jgi:Electron transfer DM13
MEMLPDAQARPRRRSIVARHPWLTAGALAVGAAIALPVVAFIIVPALVRSTVTESLPVASPPVAGPLSTPAAPSTPVLVQGELRRLDAAHFGRGKVLIAEVSGTRYLRFEHVEIAGAPDVYVYLSDRTDGLPGTFTNLGKLKATSGAFNYTIPADLDLTRVKSVVAWCRAFSVTITFATLDKA